MMPPYQPAAAPQGGRQTYIVSVELKDDFEPNLELDYGTGKPIMQLSCPTSMVYILTSDGNGTPLSPKALEIPLVFPIISDVRVDYVHGARREVNEVAKIKAPITQYTGEEPPLIRLLCAGTSGRVGFIDRGTSPKHSRGTGFPALKPPKIGEGLFDYKVTIDEEILAEVGVSDDPSEDNPEMPTQMFIVATVTLSGRITASKSADNDY